MASNAARNNDSPSAQVRAFARQRAEQPIVPPPPNYPPSNGAAHPQRNRSTKIEINKLSLMPDLPGLPPLSFSFNKTVVNGGGTGGGKATPGSGFTSDEDIRAYCEALRKEHRPRSVLRALDAETLESVLRALPDVNGSMSGSRMRARRVTRPLRRIAAAEKLIAKQAAVLWSVFTREFDAELAQISRGRTSQQQRRPQSVWKQW